jgi:hypothetical protein
MADNKKKQTSITLDELCALINKNGDRIIESQNENRAQNTEILFRIEKVLTRYGLGDNGSKKPVVKKDKDKNKNKNKDKDKNKDNEKDKEFPTTFSNTMYWWVAMYAVQDPLINKCFTNDEVKKAEESIEGIKDKPEGYDRRRAIGLTIWKGFAKSKKSNELKTLYDNWKKEAAKSLAKDVEKEKNTDDESDENDKEEAPSYNEANDVEDDNE